MGVTWQKDGVQGHGEPGPRVFDPFDLERAKAVAVALVVQVGLTPDKVREIVGPKPKRVYPPRSDADVANYVPESAHPVCHACHRPL